MPLATDPTQWKWYTLKSDRKPGTGNREAPAAPRFRLRFLTARELRQYRELAEGGDEGMKTRGVEATIELLAKALSLALTGWEGLRRPDGSQIVHAVAFPAGGQPGLLLTALEEALAPSEIWELYWAGLGQQYLTGDETKNSESPPASAPAASAASAAGPADSAGEADCRPAATPD